MAAWVADSPNVQFDDRVGSLPLRFVSAMAGVLGVGGNLAEWSEAELAEARNWVDLYKEIRPVVQLGAQYRLRSPRGGLGAAPYVRGEEAVVLMWLDRQRYEERPPALRLRGLDPSATCVCRDTGEVHHGSVLLHQGPRAGLRGGPRRAGAEAPSRMTSAECPY